MLLAERLRFQGLPTGECAYALWNNYLESIRRVRYVRIVREQTLSPRRTDPNDFLFDPIRAAVLHARAGNIEETFWLVFLFVHFGKHRKHGWSYIRAVYGRLGQGEYWDWSQTSNNLAEFGLWLARYRTQIQAVPGGFGNHRKYQSLHPFSKSGTGAAIETYVRWINPPRTHRTFFLGLLCKSRRKLKEGF